MTGNNKQKASEIDEAALDQAAGGAIGAAAAEYAVCAGCGKKYQVSAGCPCVKPGGAIAPAGH